MTRRNIDDLSASGATNMSSPIESESGAMMSPPAPQASPAARSPINGSVRQDVPSPPTMLATMTPVNVLELKKELDDKRDEHTAVYQVKTEMIYPADKEDGTADLYKHHHHHQHHAPIDLIYEDGNKTVIYTTTPDQKGLEIYSSQAGADVTINNINAHAHLSDVLMDGPDDGDASAASAAAIAAAAAAAEQAGPPGAVSVVLQAGAQGLLQYPQSQVPGTTVLVLSELVEDMSAVPVLGLRKRKNSLESSGVGGGGGGEAQGTGAGGGVSPLQGHGAARMADLSGDQQHHQQQQQQQSVADQEQHTWRAYYEHPLTAATTAMLNISGGGADDQAATMGFIYEYYKLPPLAPDAATKDKLADIWPSSSPPSGILTSQLKAANGLVSGAGLEIAAPPLGTTLGGQLAAQTDIGLFINQQHVGYAQPSSGSGAGAATLGQNLQIVKREPEDLSHHRKLDTGSPDLDNGAGVVFGSKQQRPKVVLVSSANGQPGDLVVDVNTHAVIKDESHVHRGLNSPQHGSRSINGTPTSTHSSLLADGSNTGPIELISAADGTIKQTMYSTQMFSTHGSASGSPSPIPYSEHGTQYSQSVLAAAYVSAGGAGNGGSGAGTVRAVSGATGSGNGSGSVTATSGAAAAAAAAAAFTVADPYYREYFTTVASGGGTPEPVYTTQLRQNQIGGYGDGAETSAVVATPSFVERYVRQSSAYHSKGVIAAAGLTVDLPSPDSGIGADAITPRDQNALQQSFDYTELCQPNTDLLNPTTLGGQRATATGASPGSGTGGRSRPWHDFGRQNDADKIQIPKLYSPVGFKYHLETPISTSQRREDDRITYINKGQFYGISLEYIPDPDKPLKSQTVKSIVMLMFREEKSPEDEIKAWQFWHGRQHSVKQRILDADTKNSVGLVGCIEEVAHNAIAVYWNPLDSSAKINVAVQCLSTDFSSQKGVKVYMLLYPVDPRSFGDCILSDDFMLCSGLPLHLQIDTYEEPRDTVVSHRGYCQIKVFCDKGAERKTRDEERRAAKRKMTATGRKKLDELYHPVSERSEFYSMSDLTKPPVLFTPAEDIDKLTSMELQGFYNHETDSSLSGGGGGGGAGPGAESVQHLKSGSPFLLHAAVKQPTTPTLKFHNHFPPDADKKDGILEANVVTTDGAVFSPPLKRPKLMSAPGGTGPPPLNERVMLYVRQEAEEVYTPLHVVPPTTAGLLNAIEHKYKIDSSRVNNLFRKNRKGILAKIDDEMVTYYCNEDLFILEVKAVGMDEDLYDITFIELPDH